MSPPALVRLTNPSVSPTSAKILAARMAALKADAQRDGSPLPMSMPGDSAQETTALLNTVFALLGSAVTTFGISAWMESECSNGLLGLCHTVPDSEGRPLLRTGSIRPVGA